MSMELIDKRKLIEKVKTFHKWNLYTDNFPLIPSKRYGVGYLADNVLFGIDSEPTVKAIPKDQYETRLKADMVAMLEQLDLEIQEQIAFMGDGEETNGMKRADYLIKDKINALKQSIWQDNYNGKKEKPKEVEQ